MPAAGILDRDVDILVVGAGIVGSAIAYHLALHDAGTIAVVDRGRLGDPPGSSGHAPGFLGRNSPDQAMAEFAEYTADTFSSLPSDAPAARRIGSLEVTRHSAQLPVLERKARRAGELGFRAELVNASDIGELIPYISPEPLAGGLHVLDDAAIEPRRAMAAYQSSARARGVTFAEGVEVVGFRHDGSGVAGVMTPAGPIRARQTVLAVGVWGRALLRKLQLDLPLFAFAHPYVRTGPSACLAGLAAARARPLLRDVDHGFYLREHGDRLGFGWYNHPPMIVEVEDQGTADIGFVDEWLRDARTDLFPFLQTTDLSARLNGLFIMTPDGLPVLGPVDRVPGLWLAEAVWVTQSAGVGRLVAELLSGRPPSVDRAAFRAERFAGASTDRLQAAAVDNYRNIYRWPAEQFSEG